MFRNQYDTDVTVFSPAGRLHQVEYAMEAVKQGSVVLGAKTSTHVVLATLKRAPHVELSTHQKKIFAMDSHVGFAFSGLSGDARVLSKFMRTECMHHRFAYGSAVPVSRLVLKVADKSQLATQRSYKRPFGVGLLVAGCDQTGTHLYQTCPSGNYFDVLAMAIGARSQSSRTYLEREYESFEGISLQELVRHTLLALQSATEEDVELTSKNTAVGIVGIDRDFEIFEDEKVMPFLELIQKTEEEEVDDAMDAET